MIGNQEFNIGLIGYGYWGKNLLRNLKESVLVKHITVADSNPEVISKLATSDKSIEATTQVQSVLADPEIHAVLIATPGSTHFKLAFDALANGKHVFVEKPLVTRSSDALKLKKESEAKSLVAFVDHTFLYNDAVKRIKKLIDDGSLGKISYIDSTRINLGIYQQDVNVMWDLAAHDISMVNYWIDALPNSVRAIGRVNEQHEVLDIAYIFLNYPSGLLVQINCSWASPVKIRKTIIGGSQRMIIYDDVEPTDKLKIYDYVNFEDENPDPNRVLIDYRLGDVTIPKLSLQEPLKAAVNDFLECIIQGAEPVSDIRTGIDVLRILEKADISLKEGGKPIPLD